jgi:hypothetical protein
MQSLLDSRRALSDSGWQITQNDQGNTCGTAVKAASAGTAGTSSSAAAVAAAAAPSEMPDDIILMLTQREALLAAADAATQQHEHGQLAAQLAAMQLSLEKVSGKSSQWAVPMNFAGVYFVCNLLALLTE